MSKRGRQGSRHRLRHSGVVLLVISALFLTGSACGKHDPAPASFRLDSMPNTTMSTQGFVKAERPQAFNFERIGCVASQGDLPVESVTLHAPTSGLVLSDWGARAAGPHAPAAIDWGIFPVRKHPLAKLGLHKSAWTGHCGEEVEQLVVAVQLKADSESGAAAGVDVHFSDGTSTWVPIGIGLCVHKCTSALIDPVVAAINSQRDAAAA